MKTQEQSQQEWIFKVEDTSYFRMPEDRDPEDFECYEFLAGGDRMTHEEAQDMLWDYECSHADSRGEPDFKECVHCEGIGCESCDGKGGWEEEYSEFVRKHAQGTLVAYDPTKHMAVKSKRPEHLKYSHEQAVAALQVIIKSSEQGLLEMEQRLAELGADIAKRKNTLTEYKLKLIKLENQ